MNTCHICDRTALNAAKPLSIRLPRMAVDEKLAYVESVLDVLLESRFGPGYSYSYLERPDSNAADEPADFAFDPLDYIGEDPAPWYERGSLGRQLRCSDRFFRLPFGLANGSSPSQNTPGFSPRSSAKADRGFGTDIRWLRLQHSRFYDARTQTAISGTHIFGRGSPPESLTHLLPSRLPLRP